MLKTVWYLYSADKHLLAICYSAALTYLIYMNLTAQGYFITVVEDEEAV